MAVTFEDIDEALKTVRLLRLPMALQFASVVEFDYAVGYLQGRGFRFEGTMDPGRGKYELVITCR